MEERGIVASKSFHFLVLTRKKIGEKDVEVVEAKKGRLPQVYFLLFKHLSPKHGRKEVKNKTLGVRARGKTKKVAASKIKLATKKNGMGSPLTGMGRKSRGEPRETTERHCSRGITRFSSQGKK